KLYIRILVRMNVQDTEAKGYSGGLPVCVVWGDLSFQFARLQNSALFEHGNQGQGIALVIVPLGLTITGILFPGCNTANQMLSEILPFEMALLGQRQRHPEHGALPCFAKD